MSSFKVVVTTTLYDPSSVSVAPEMLLTVIPDASCLSIQKRSCWKSEGIVEPHRRQCHQIQNNPQGY